MAETIKQQDTYDAYMHDMTVYSILVNRRRGIAEIKDGLKLVQRRIIWTLFHYEHMTQPENKTIKSAKAAGDTMSNLHPHSSSYSAFPLMANDFQTKLPLLKAQGNFGNVAGDRESSDRYTEVTLSRFAYDAITSNFSEGTTVVDMIPNYLGDDLEPKYLPVAVPLLLINGTNGIGVGMKSDVPCHNVQEVLMATKMLLHDPNFTPTLIPDSFLPTEIIKEDWETINKTGCGSYRERGIAKIEECNLPERKEYKGLPCIHITSLPDGVYSNTIYQELEKLVANKQIPMLKDALDKSGAGIIDIYVILNKGSDPNFVKNLLYKKTSLETTMNIQFDAVDDLETHRYSYKKYLESFIEFRKFTKYRMYAMKAQNIETDIHKLDLYVKVMNSGEMDKIIDMIKKMKGTDLGEYEEYFIKKLNITDIQARYLINISLPKLSLGFKRKYEEQLKKLKKDYDDVEKYITNPKYIIDEIDKELDYFIANYSMPRMAKVISNKHEDDIPAGMFKIVITENNFIRKLSINDKAGSIRGDAPKMVGLIDNRDSLILFDDRGKVFKLPVYKIPLTDKGSNGVDIRLMIKGCTANIAQMMGEQFIIDMSKSKTKSKYFITILTKHNCIKRVELADFLNIPSIGMIYTKLMADDSVISVEMIPDVLDVLIYSDHRALRIQDKQIPVYKRISQGVLAMNSKTDLEGLSIIYSGAKYIVVVTNKGYINKFSISGLERTDRNKAGSKVINLKKGDSIKAIYGVKDGDTLMVITPEGKVDIPVNDIPIGTSVSNGTKFFKDKDIVIKVGIEAAQ